MPIATGRLQAVADQWAGFPAAADPRPLVLTEHPSRFHGYDSDEAKTAGQAGAIVSAIDLPDGVLAAVRGPRGPDREEPGRLHLTITACRAVQHRFGTDRGLVELPAWELRMTHTVGPLVILEPRLAASAWPQERRGFAFFGEGGTVHEDGRTITVTFLHDHDEDGPVAYPRADLVETDTAVVIAPVAVPVDPRQHTPTGRMPEITVTLRRPLGHRVLLSPRGWPLPVTPAVD
jgi:hypothetical protein